jgi:serine kinase of HPr protein (carbohydrate metabolism regulator)
MSSALTSETLHATCVCKNGNAVLISGPSGAGKSDLALRLIDRGAALVSDDYTILQNVDGVLRARAPDTIKGQIEVRGIGIINIDPVQDVPVLLIIELMAAPDRYPLEPLQRVIAGVTIPVIGLSPFEASSPIKAEMALARTLKP